MQLIELNPAGNFDPWDPVKLDELQNVRCVKKLGQHLFFENETMRLWEICLKPKERLAFHKRSQFYSWTCHTDGLLISRYENGQINMLKFKKGETKYWDFGESGIVADLENIGEDTLVLHVIEYVYEATNKPDNISSLNMEN